MDDIGAIRRWARKNHIAIEAGGRIPRRILQMYAEAASSNQEGRSSEVSTRYDLLAKYLEPRFGSIYNGDGGLDEGLPWTPELRQAARRYLLVELPTDVRAAMFIAPDDLEDADAWEKEVDGLFASLTISEIGLAVRSAAVAAQPTLDQVTGQSDDWPGGEDQKLDAEFWLEAHADERELKDVASFLHERYERPTPAEMTPYALVTYYSPARLVEAWQHAVGPAPSDLVDTEWQILQPFLPQRSGYRDPQVRRSIDGMLYCFERKISISNVPERYGRPGSLLSQRSRYRRAGIYHHALSELDGTPGGERLVAWLHETVKPPETA